MLFQTPVGPLTLGYKGENLICEFGGKKVDSQPPKRLAKQLKSYLEGKTIKRFDVKTPAGPKFTQNCWEACRNIPYGKTLTYQMLAKNAGSAKAMRAAGQAMRKNPLVILTPCHRVIGSSGKLHGYAGTTDPESVQLKRKAYLLDLERRTMSI